MKARVYSGQSDQEMLRIGSDLVAAITPRSEAPIEYQPIAPLEDLLGIASTVYDQIHAALVSGKRHMIFYGPPGTGKTTLAEHVARVLAPDGEYEMLTASSSWTSQELIGGYQPLGGGKISFVPGVLLRNRRKPVIIDELNRCPIDKVIGPLFSVLSGQATTLPYRVKVEDEDSPFHVMLPKEKPGAEKYEWCLGSHFRLIATLNTVDKSQLGQISFALSRRFAWIKVGLPEDLDAFVISILLRNRILQTPAEVAGSNPAAAMWRAVNSVREIGGAPIIDFVKAVNAMEDTIDFLAVPDDRAQRVFIDGMCMCILPLLDGIHRGESKQLLDELAAVWALSDRRRGDLEKHIADLVA